jgi:hypothetical protein
VVYDSLDGGTTATVTVVCDTLGRNPFINTVEVKAKTSDALTTPDLTADHTTPANRLSVTGNADVTATKCCKSVQVDPDTLAPEVCVNITLTNNSDPLEPLENIKVEDDVLGTVLTGGTLGITSADKSTTISECYTPTASDQPAGDPVDTDLITFTDNVTEVSGRGKTSGATFSLIGAALPTATCNLCGPQNQACPEEPTEE